METAINRAAVVDETLLRPPPSAPDEVPKQQRRPDALARDVHRAVQLQSELV